MLSVIGYILLVVVIALVAAYFYVESQRKKAIQAQKRAISLRVSKIKNRYKDELLAFVEQELITIPQHEVLYRIANNFFIFQPINDKSIEYCEFTLNNIIGAFLNITPSTPNYEELKEQITIFVSKLPMQSREFNPNFYRSKLPSLTEQLIAAKEEINNVDTDISILDEEIDIDDATNVKKIIKESIDPELTTN